jgi:predicted nucleic acid-binding protein
MLPTSIEILTLLTGAQFLIAYLGRDEESQARIRELLQKIEHAVEGDAVTNLTTVHQLARELSPPRFDRSTEQAVKTLADQAQQLELGF